MAQIGVIAQEVRERWSLYQGDCCEVLRGIPTASIGLSVFSPPFASLYSYSDSARDLGNAQNYGEFWEHFDFVVKELARVMMPGREVAIHCMDLPKIKTREGVIGLRDFSGDMIRAFERRDFIFHSRHVIWKDPLIQATRTKSLGLAHKQIVKDSTMCRAGLPDFLIAMRAPGDNPEPVSHRQSAGFARYIGEGGEPLATRTKEPKTNRYSQHIWRRYASPVWMDIDPSNTLNRNGAREEKDERHICPLQLDVIARVLELWSNPGDVVLSPFAGIGSEGYMAVREGRRFIGIELKESYYRQAILNLEKAEMAINEGTLFEAEAYTKER